MNRFILIFMRCIFLVINYNILIFIILILITSIISCTDDDTIQKGCEGTVVNNLKNTTLLATSSVIGHVFMSEDLGIILPKCSRSQTIDELFWEWAEREDYDWRSINPNGMWVSVSGPLYQPLVNETPSEFHLMTATHIQEVNVENVLEEFNFYLFEVPYGDTLGYGYYLEYNGFNIKQYEIPAVPGIQPFKTRAEALKIAYLVAYKLKNQQGLPSISVSDLGFFNIETDW